MAIWREPALEELIGGPLDASGLTEQAINDLVNNRASEGDQLDFKLKPHLPSVGATSSPAGPPNWKPEQEWSKDVCEMANHRGGLLLIGIEERGGIATGATPTVEDPETLEKRLRVALMNYAAPTPLVAFVAIPAAGGDYYLAVIVPPSGKAPHAVTDGPGGSRRSLRFPVRDGSDTRWMLETEVADQYRVRGLRRFDREASLSEAVAAGVSQLGLASGLWLYVCSNPESPASVQLDQASVDQVKGWRDMYHFTSPFGRILHVDHAAFPAPGRVTFTGRSLQPSTGEVTDPRDGYLELYADGRSFAAKPVHVDTSPDSSPGQIGHLTLVDDTCIALDVALSWSVHQAGAWGTTEVEVGIVDGDGLEGPYTSSLTLHSAAPGSLPRVPNTRRVRHPIRARVAVDLLESQTQRGRMAAVHDVATALLQHFGVAEADMIESDGTLISGNWGWAEAREVERWADERDVPHRR